MHNVLEIAIRLYKCQFIHIFPNSQTTYISIFIRKVAIKSLMNIQGLQWIPYQMDYKASSIMCYNGHSFHWIIHISCLTFSNIWVNRLLPFKVKHVMILEEQKFLCLSIIKSILVNT